MSDDNSIQKGCVEYVISEEDFEPKNPDDPPLKNETDQFRKVELVHNNQTKEDGDEIIEDNQDYVRIQLSPKGSLFANQVDTFVRTPFHSAICHFEGYQFYPVHAAVTKYYPNGSLQHILKEINEGKKHPEWNGTMKSKCFFGLVSAVTHIHNIFDEENPNFSIRYLCPENIIFDENNEPKLIHYVFGNEELGVKPNAYIPPELHENPNGSRYDEDIWAIGMIAYEILTGHKPYQGKSEDEIKAAVINGDLPEFPPNSLETDDIIGIIQNCLLKDPKKRPLPYMLFFHLLNLTDNLFPDTDKLDYDIYRDEIQQETVQSDESITYPRIIQGDDIDNTELFRKAEEKDPYSLVYVGRLYQKGHCGVEKNVTKAFQYYKNAADLNYAVGMYNASICLRDGIGCKVDLKQSFELMKKAALSNLEIAVSSYAIMVLDGVGTEKNEKEAIRILEDGAKKNYKECLNALGYFYFDGINGVEKNVSKGLSLLKRAAQYGSGEANCTIAFHYFNQYKNDKDKDPATINKALNLFVKAADMKSASAFYNLGRIYETGKEIPKDLNKSFEYYKESSKLKYVEGMFKYGLFLYKGFGTPKDIRRASTILHDAAVKGNKNAQYFYAKIIYNGEGGVPKDIKNALYFFKLAADQDINLAMFYSAQIYINGEGGVARNHSNGRNYLQRYMKRVPEEKRIKDWIELWNKVK